jgi:hypothetical protein
LMRSAMRSYSCAAWKQKRKEREAGDEHGAATTDAVCVCVCVPRRVL